MISENKQIVKNLSFNIASFAINFSISFFLTPYLIKTVGKDSFSFVPLINSIIGYSTIITAATGSMAGRFITMRIYKDDVNGANKFLNSVWVINLFLSVLFTIIAIFATVFLDKILTIPEGILFDIQILFSLSAAALIINLLSGLLGIGAYVKNRIDLSASRNTIADISKLAVIIFLFYFAKPSITYIGIGTLFSAIILALLDVSLKKKLLPELAFSPFNNFSFKHVKEVFFSGIWNSVNQISNILLQQFDLLIANIFVGVSAAGDYTIAKTVPLFIYSILAMLSGTFIPHFNILFAKGQYEDLIAEVKKSMSIVGMLVGIPIGFLIVYSKEFYELWVPGEDSSILFKLTLITLFPMIIGGSINPIFGTFTTTNKLKIPSIVLLIAGIANTLATMLLLYFTNLGIWAIAITSAIQSTLRNLIFTPIYGAHCLNQKWHTFYPTIIKGIIGMLIVAILGVLAKNIFPNNTWCSLFTKLCAISICSLVINPFILFSSTDRMKMKEIIREKIS